MTHFASPSLQGDAKMLHKKHYIALASMLKHAKDLEDFKSELIMYLADDNSRFDVDRFTKACGGDE